MAPWRIVAQSAAALAASIGVGRFVYTPILPLMHEQAGLSSHAAASLATANYVGYLAGALAGIAAPRLLRSRAVLRAALVVLAGTLALMPATEVAAAWSGLRLVAGVASALVFMIAVSAGLTRLRAHADHLTGWAFSGVGVGIALSGALVLAIRPAADWRAAWWASAVVTLVLTAGAWRLAPSPAPAAGAAAARARARGQRWFAAVFAAYSLEGIGYIIAGTFLVAAIDESAADWVGSSAWLLVGLAAAPSAALWAGLGQRWPRESLLTAALLLQAAGTVLPAIATGVGPALISAMLFGGTFMGIGTLALAIGEHRGFPRAVAILTAGYSAGQVLGPLVVTPLLDDGYRPALFVGAGVVLAGALAAAVIPVERG